MSGDAFSVVGGGLAGPLMAAHLGRAGHRTTLYEMRPDPRVAGSGGGRSINLALSRRGMHALDAVGVLDRVLELGLPMRGRMMHGVSGSLTFQPYGTRPEHVLHSVPRGLLNEALLDVAEATPGVSVAFEHKCTEVDLDGRTVTFEVGREGAGKRVAAGTVVGADGAYSRVRAAMRRRDRFDYRQDYLDYGYKELSMPPASGGGFALDPGALHIWPRRSYMMIALPNRDFTFTCTLFWPFDGPVSFAAIREPDAVRRFFDERFPDVSGLLPDLTEQFAANPVGSLVTVRCRPWSVEDRAVLIGDACHAVVPFYGQGMNAAFEDCTVLDACLGRSPDRAASFRAYESRSRDANAIADLALANFVEMRDHVGSRSFLVRKWTERVLSRFLGFWYVPLYTMVSFTRIPYAEARDRARRQDRMVMAGALVLLVALLAAAAALGRR